LIDLEEQFSFVVKLLLCFSIIYVSISEICLLSEKYIIQILIFNYSSYLRDRFFRTWTYAILNNSDVNLILLLFLLLRSWSFCLLSNTLISVSWNSHILIRTAVCVKISYISELFSAQAFWNFCFLVWFTDRFLSTSKIIENKNLILLKVLYFVLQLFSRYWFLRRRNRSCYRFDFYFSR